MENEKAKHTPGPWDVYAGNEGHPVIHSPEFEKYAGGGIIGIAETRTVGEKEMEQANARLIAAAPELLEVAEILSDALGYLQSDGEIPAAYWKVLREKSCAAIRKAKGE